MSAPSSSPDAPLTRKRVLWKGEDHLGCINVHVLCVACARGSSGRVTAWGGGFNFLHPFLFVLREGDGYDASPQQLQGSGDDDGKHEGYVYGVALTHDGLTLLSVSFDTPDVLVWDVSVARSRVIKRLKGHSRGFYGTPIATAIGVDAQQWAMSGSEDGTVILWWLDMAEAVHTLRHGSEVCAVAFSHDARLCASGGYDKAVKLWRTDTGACMHTMEGHGHWIRAFSFSSDARRLASASDDKSIRVWSIEDATCLRELKGHTDYVYGCLWSPGDRFIVSCGRDKSLRVWDPNTGKLVHTVKDAHSDWVRCLCADPSMETYVSGSNDSIVEWRSLRSLARHHYLLLARTSEESLNRSVDGSNGALRAVRTTGRAITVAYQVCGMLP